MSKPFGIVYCATNNSDGKKYVGITTRKLSHRKNGHSLIKKHGNNFQWEILEECLTKNDLCEKEKFYINKYNSNHPDYGYNKSTGGIINVLKTRNTRFVGVRLPEWLISAIDNDAEKTFRTRSNAIEAGLASIYQKNTKVRHSSANRE